MRRVHRWTVALLTTCGLWLIAVSQVAAHPGHDHAEQSSSQGFQYGTELIVVAAFIGAAVLIYGLVQEIRQRD